MTTLSITIPEEFNTACLDAIAENEETSASTLRVKDIAAKFPGVNTQRLSVFLKEWKVLNVGSDLGLKAKYQSLVCSVETAIQMLDDMIDEPDSPLVNVLVYLQDAIATEQEA